MLDLLAGVAVSFILPHDTSGMLEATVGCAALRALSASLPSASARVAAGPAMDVSHRRLAVSALCFLVISQAAGNSYHVGDYVPVARQAQFHAVSLMVRERKSIGGLRYGR